MILNKVLARLYRNAEVEGSSGEAAPAAETTEVGQAVDWAAFSGETPGAFDESTEGEEPQVEPENSPEETPENTAPTPPTTEENPPSETPGETPTPVEPPKTPEPNAEEIAAQQKQLQEDFQKWEAAQIEELTGVYGFDEETAMRLQTEPELVLPKLAAQLQINAVKQAVEVVQRMIPQMVPQVQQQMSRVQQAEELFYGVNPDLKGKEAQVLAAGKMFREINPKASPEEAAKQIGIIVRQSMGLPALEAGAKPATQKPPKPAPHKPAAAGGGRAAAPAPTDKSMWAKLVEDDDD